MNNYKETFLKESPWKEAYEAMELYSDFFNKVLEPNTRILFVGTGWENAQYFDWPTTLLKVEPTLKISYLEVSDIYIEKWKNGIFPLIVGDIRNIDKILEINDFDVICWFHGPEHIEQTEMLDTFNKVFSVVKKGIVFACPWGNYYDYQHALNENEYEIHKNKSMDEHCFIEGFENYTINYCDGKDTPKGNIIITRIKS
jgi:hypothetical protein